LRAQAEALSVVSSDGSVRVNDGRSTTDPRVSIVVDDATQWVDDQSMRPPASRPVYDLVVIDSTDFSVGGEWSPQTYAQIKLLMRDEGKQKRRNDAPLCPPTCTQWKAVALRLPRQARDRHKGRRGRFNTAVSLLIVSSSPRTEIDHACKSRYALPVLGAKNGIFFEFSLCLSRACLGKMIVFI
jgi:hypothetical protein